jgi:hypothetical protein
MRAVGGTVGGTGGAAAEAERGWVWAGERDASDGRKSAEVVTESDFEAGEQRRDAIGLDGRFRV